MTDMKTEFMGKFVAGRLYFYRVLASFMLVVWAFSSLKLIRMVLFIFHNFCLSGMFVLFVKAGRWDKLLLFHLMAQIYMQLFGGYK